MIQVRRVGGEVDTLPFEIFEEEVRSGLIDGGTLLRFPPVTGDDFQQARTLELWLSVENSPRTRFDRSFTLAGLPVATLSFSVFLALVFAWQVHQGLSLDGTDLVDQGAKSMAHQRELGQWWRLLTGSFLHSGWLHLVFNLLFLVYVGRNVEAILGWGGTWLLVVLSGTGAMAASSLSTDVHTVGASGVTFAFLGAAVALGWRYSSWMPRAVRAKYGVPIVPFVAFFLVFSALWPATDNFCHFGGLAIGVFLGLFLPCPLEKPWGQVRRLGLIEAGLAVAMAGVVTVILPLAWNFGFMPGPSLAPRSVELEEAGVRLKPPRDWPAVLRSVPGEGWSSRTGMGQLSVQTWVEELGVLEPSEVPSHWIGELESRAVVLPRAAPSPQSLGLGEGWLTFEADLVTGEERLRLLRVGWLRGAYLTSVDFLHPIDSWGVYSSLRSESLGTIEFQQPAAVVRALDELLGDTMPLGTPVLPFLDVVASRPVTERGETLRLAAELARIGDADRALRLLEALEQAGEPSDDVAYWRLWIEHHLLGRSDASSLTDVRDLMSRRSDSLIVLALAWSIHEASGDGEGAGAILDQLGERWPDRAALLGKRGRLRSP